MKKIVLILALAGICACANAREGDFYSLDGSNWQLEKLVSAPKTVFFVWTTWCPYCRKELERLAQSCSVAEGVEVFFVNAGEQQSVVEGYARAKKLPECIRKRIILDTNSTIANQFNVVGIPTYLFFKDGSNVHKSYYLDRSLIEQVY